MVMSPRNDSSTVQRHMQDVNEKSLAAFIQDYLPSSSGWTSWSNPRDKVGYDISLETANSLSSTDFEACFNLIAVTSSADYKNSTVGWKVRAKKNEMKSTDLKYVLVKKEGASQTSAFLSLMPTMEDDFAVLYCYEIHLAPEVQGTGLGSILMNLFEEVAEKVPLVEKVMLSCFRRNERAVRFYRKRGYELDRFSPPPKILRTGVKIESDYIIMSKAIHR
ncbi:MAG: hypothetical protein M1818_002868 [Claussenomyces sp. TS43310]|nr:MAG: hypothetical protein M1818_002868 [Claussenomyces sp. TS43310]